MKFFEKNYPPVTEKFPAFYKGELSGSIYLAFSPTNVVCVKSSTGISLGFNNHDLHDCTRMPSGYSLELTQE